jgi:hypothetical protein
MFNLFKKENTDLKHPIFNNNSWAVPKETVIGQHERKVTKINLKDNKECIVYDNFLEQRFFDDIFRVLTQANFPWYLNESVSNPGDGLFQFVHVFYDRNTWISNEERIISPVINTIHEVISEHPILIRIKANIRPRSYKLDPAPYHKDCTWLQDRKIWYTGILYVTDNDGYTFFEGCDEKIQSKENRFIVFPSDVSHSGTTSTNDQDGIKQHRILINFNWF